MDSITHFFETRLGKITFILGLAIGAHIIVIIIKKINIYLTHTINNKKSKWNSIRTLGTSLLIFAVYFIALGLILWEMDISLSAYLASASIIGLAVGFGTQGAIQDIITGLTIVLSDLIDVGDLVEVNGVTGIVRSINMRFIEIEDHLNAKAFIPNRTISKVINYPKGYISCSIDYAITDIESNNETLAQEIEKLIKSLKEQFESIFRGPISIYNEKETLSGKKYSRIKLRIWPGRGGIIESTFKQELLSKLKDYNPNYKDWMVTINYEVENSKTVVKSNNGERYKSNQIK